MNKFKFVVLMVFVILSSKLGAMNQEETQFAPLGSNVHFQSLFESDEYKWFINRLQGKDCRERVTSLMTEAISSIGADWLTVEGDNSAKEALTWNSYFPTQKIFFFDVLTDYYQVLFDPDIVLSFNLLFGLHAQSIARNLNDISGLPVEQSKQQIIKNYLAYYKHAIESDELTEELRINYVIYEANLVLMLIFLICKIEQQIRQKIVEGFFKSF